MRVPLSLQQLEAFVEVARTANFRQAAVNLHVSQPALSRTIRLAEEALDTRLFDRDTRHVDLTPSGRELLPIAQRILQDFDSGFSELGQFLEGRRGHITVVTLPSVGVAWLVPAIATFRKKFPQVGFTMLEGPDQALRAALMEGRADFAVTMRPKQQEPYRYTHLLDDPFIALCRKDHPVANRKKVHWSAFAAEPFLSAASSSSIRPITDAAFLRGRQAVPDGLEYPSIPAVAAMVRAGLGITAIPQLSLNLLDMQDLTTVSLVGPVMTRPIGVVTRAGRSLSPVARAFIDDVAALVSGKVDLSV